MEYDWRRPFQNLSVPVKFDKAEKATGKLLQKCIKNKLKS